MRLRDLERAVSRSTRRSGITAYVVGGAVRDAIVGRRVSDVDLAVPRGEEQLARDLAAEGFGSAFPLSSPDSAIPVWRVARGGQTIDVARFERGAAIEEDLARRDFTINAMAREVGSERIIDPHHGRRDLRRCVIRAISEENLRSDPLRVLRAYRLAATREWRIDRRTRRWLSRNSSALLDVAAERVHDELGRLLASPSPKTIGDAIVDGVFEGTLGLPRAPALGRTVAILPRKRRNETPCAVLSLRLAVLFRTAGMDAARATRVLARAKFTREETRETARRIQFLDGLFAGAEPRRLLFAHRDDLAPFLRLARVAAFTASERRRAQALSAAARRTTSASPPVDGDDLREWLGVPPGRELGRYLDEARFRWFTKEWRSREQLRRGLLDRFKFDRTSRLG